MLMDAACLDHFNGILYLVVAHIFVELCLFYWAIGNLYMFDSEVLNGKSFHLSAFQVVFDALIFFKITFLKNYDR